MRQTSLHSSATVPAPYNRFNDEDPIAGSSTNVYSVEASVERNVGVATSQFTPGVSIPPSRFNLGPSHQVSNDIVTPYDESKPTFCNPGFGYNLYTNPAAPSTNDNLSITTSSLPTFMYMTDVSPLGRPPALWNAAVGDIRRGDDLAWPGNYFPSPASLAETSPARTNLGQPTISEQPPAATPPTTHSYTDWHYGPIQYPPPPLPLFPPSLLPVMHHNPLNAATGSRPPTVESCAVDFYNRLNHTHVSVQEPIIVVRIGSCLSRCTPPEAYLTHTQELKQDPYVKGLRKKVGDVPRSIEYDAYSLERAFKEDTSGISDPDEVAFPNLRMAQKMSFVFNVRRDFQDTRSSPLLYLTLVAPLCPVPRLPP